MPLSKMRIAGLDRSAARSYNLSRPTDQVLVNAPRLRRKHTILTTRRLKEEALRAREFARRARERARTADPPLPRYVPPTDQQRTESRSIPRRIIQSWCNRNLTPGIVNLCASHRQCNPGYEYVFYDDKECRDFIKEHFHENVLHAYDALIPGAFKADLFRYCELYVNGGWWFDIDMLSVGSIDAFVRPEIEFACPKDGGITDGPGLYQAILGAGKMNKVLEDVIRRIVVTVAESPESHKGRWGRSRRNLAYTGPCLLAECAINVLSIRTDTSSNAWETTTTHDFGDSCTLSGYCSLGSGVVAIGHASRQQTRHQKLILSEYSRLRARQHAQPTYENRYTGAPYMFPNLVSACQQPPANNRLRILRSTDRLTSSRQSPVPDEAI